MRHSEIDKRSKRNSPRQCVADYGHNVHKDAPARLPDLNLPISLGPLAQWVEQIMRKRQLALMDGECF